MTLMKVGTEQGNREIFVESVSALLRNLRAYASKNGLVIKGLSRDWLNSDGKFEVRKGMRALTLEARSPNAVGGDAKVDRVWSIAIQSVVGGDEIVLGRWPLGWRRLNLKSVPPGFDEIDIGSYFESILSEFFGIKRETN